MLISAQGYVALDQAALVAGAGSRDCDRELAAGYTEWCRAAILPDGDGLAVVLTDNYVDVDGLLIAGTPTEGLGCPALPEGLVTPDYVTPPMTIVVTGPLVTGDTAAAPLG